MYFKPIFALPQENIEKLSHKMIFDNTTYFWRFFCWKGFSFSCLEHTALYWSKENRFIISANTHHSHQRSLILSLVILPIWVNNLTKSLCQESKYQSNYMFNLQQNRFKLQLAHWHGNFNWESRLQSRDSHLSTSFLADFQNGYKCQHSIISLMFHFP